MAKTGPSETGCSRNTPGSGVSASDVDETIFKAVISEPGRLDPGPGLVDIMYTGPSRRRPCRRDVHRGRSTTPVCDHVRDAGASMPRVGGRD